MLGGKAPNCIQVCDLDRLDWSEGNSLMSMYVSSTSTLRTPAQYQAALQQMAQYGLTKHAERARRAMIASSLPAPVRHFLALRAAGRVSFDQKGVDAKVIKVAEEAIRSLLPERDVKVRCVVTRDTKTPYVFGLRMQDSASVFAALTPSWRRTVLEESAVTVDGHFVLRLNPSTEHRKGRSGQVLSWEGEGDLQWAEIKIKKATFTRAHAQDPWSLRVRD